VPGGALLEGVSQPAGGSRHGEQPWAHRGGHPERGDHRGEPHVDVGERVGRGLDDREQRARVLGERQARRGVEQQPRAGIAAGIDRMPEPGRDLAALA